MRQNFGGLGNKFLWNYGITRAVDKFQVGHEVINSLQQQLNVVYESACYAVSLGWVQAVVHVEVYTRHMRVTKINNIVCVCVYFVSMFVCVCVRIIPWVQETDHLKKQQTALQLKVYKLERQLERVTVTTTVSSHRSSAQNSRRKVKSGQNNGGNMKTWSVTNALSLHMLLFLAVSAASETEEKGTNTSPWLTVDWAWSAEKGGEVVHFSLSEKFS